MISDHYDLPEDIAEKLLAPDPKLEKGDTYRNMDSYAITNQNTDRDGNLIDADKASVSMRSDRNEDTLRPIAGEREEGMELQDFGADKTKVKNDEVFDNYLN